MVLDQQERNDISFSYLFIFSLAPCWLFGSQSKFENDLCNFFGLPEGHAVVVSSGSSALFLALWALKGKGKRVGFPVYSCAALRNAAGMLGSKKVFLDCAKENPNIAYKEAEKKGIDILIAPSMYGIPVE